MLNTTNALFAKPKKCFFEKSSIEYLGMIILKGHIWKDPNKVSGVTEWPRPVKIKQVQAFLGFANSYRRLIKDFAKYTKPLTILTKKDQLWVWGEEQEHVFNGLKEAFTLAPILWIPDDINPFRLESYASDFAISTVLS